jgi:hypothetical protein
LIDEMSSYGTFAPLLTCGFPAGTPDVMDKRMMCRLFHRCYRP